MLYITSFFAAQYKIFAFETLDFASRLGLKESYPRYCEPPKPADWASLSLHDTSAIRRKQISHGTEKHMTDSIALRKHFGAKLREARQFRKLSQAELARSCGSSQDYISKIERGLENISLDKISEIAAVLKADVYVLLNIKV